jgi:DNA-binding transcriptional ArsR family regulator
MNAVLALSHPTRRAIIELLLDTGEPGLPAGVIASDLDVLQSSLSADLTILLNAGLIECEIRGAAVLHRADVARVRQVAPGLVADDFLWFEYPVSEVMNPLVC